jgi:uncharacterized protein YrrD
MTDYVGGRMLKVSQLMGIYVLEPKRGYVGDPKKAPEKDLTIVGQVHQVVFDPQGLNVVGMLVRKPDVGGMIKRRDAFLALDSMTASDYGLVTTRGAESLDEAAIERLGLDWDKCILWTGVDAKTSDGKELGWVSDVEFSAKTGRVRAFFVSDGSIAKSLVGNVVIPGDMLVGYKDGFMLVQPGAAGLSLDGGLAAKAGVGYARAKQGGKEAAAKAGKAAGDAVEKGAYGLGRMIGKAKKSTKPHKKGAAKAVGKQLGRTKGMFGSFVDEFKKASE